MSAVRVLVKLHSQPKADVLLCVGPADHVQPDYGSSIVVIKRLHMSCVSSPTSIDSTRSFGKEDEEAREEVRVVRKLLTLPMHPHIVRYHSVTHEHDHISITMEHCSRGDLLTWLQQQPHKRFSEPQALAIFRQILNGVRFLHTHDIAHRDLSLENCLVTQDHTIKICDFGLATSATNVSHQHVGKLNYMAPEVVRGDYYDPVKADVWSLGIVLFMLLTGSPLVHVARESDVGFRCIQRVGISGILKHWGLQDQVSERATDLLTRMLSVDDEGRLRSIDVVIEKMEL